MHISRFTNHSHFLSGVSLSLLSSLILYQSYYVKAKVTF